MLPKCVKLFSCLEDPADSLEVEITHNSVDIEGYSCDDYTFISLSYKDAIELANLILEHTQEGK